MKQPDLLICKKKLHIMKHVTGSVLWPGDANVATKRATAAIYVAKEDIMRRVKDTPNPLVMRMSLRTALPLDEMKPTANGSMVKIPLLLLYEEKIFVAMVQRKYKSLATLTFRPVKRKETPKNLWNSFISQKRTFQKVMLLLIFRICRLWYR